jgi:hypothetical protein
MGIHESFVAADGKLLQSFATSGTGTWIALATNRCSWNGKLSRRFTRLAGCTKHGKENAQIAARNSRGDRP